MNDLSLEELERAALAYENMLAPALFQQWTGPVADAARIAPGQRVLDVACGTGVLARAVAERVGSSGSVVGLDTNPGMLSVAAAIAPTIEWCRSSAEALPFDDGSFDAVVSQFGLMFVADKQGAVDEMMRVLVPGGRFAVAVFDSLDKAPGYSAMTSVVEREVNAEVADALRNPFSMADSAEIHALFSGAGMAEVEITGREGLARFPSVREMVLADVKGWFPIAGIDLNSTAVDSLVQAAAEALKGFTASTGAVEFPVAAHIVAGASA
ncbi:MAG: class I SAM-dependent methyltransferase [Trueperaceae bacterium]